MKKIKSLGLVLLIVMVNSSFAQLKEKAKQFWMQHPVKYYRGVRNIHSTGELIYDTKQMLHSYFSILNLFILLYNEKSFHLYNK